MAKPILYNIQSFDAEQEKVFSFSYAGSISRVQALIYRNDTGICVNEFDMSQYHDTQLPEYRLLANKLTNSTVPYLIKVRVFPYGSAEPSAWSDLALFYCKKSPTISFNNLRLGEPNDITTASYEFGVTYNAGAQDEPLSTFTYRLYDRNNTLIESSPTFYSASDRYTFNNFRNNNTYYVRAIGESKNGFVVDTGYVELYITYSIGAAYANLTAENRAEMGDVVLRTNIVSIEGYYNDNNGIVYDNADDVASYINGSKADKAIFLQGGEAVTFENGYKDTKAFIFPSESSDAFNGVLIFKPHNKHPGCIFSFHEKRNNNPVSIYIYMLTRTINGVDKTYCYLLAGNDDYIVYSNAIDNYNLEYLKLHFQRVGGTYGLYLSKVEV